MDTIETRQIVLLIYVSFVEGSFNHNEVTKWDVLCAEVSVMRGTCNPCGAMD